MMLSTAMVFTTIVCMYCMYVWEVVVICISPIYYTTGRYDMAIPKFLVKDLELENILKPITDRLATIMGSPTPQLRTHNISKATLFLCKCTVCLYVCVYTCSLCFHGMYICIDLGMYTYSKHIQYCLHYIH